MDMNLGETLSSSVAGGSLHVSVDPQEIPEPGINGPQLQKPRSARDRSPSWSDWGLVVVVPLTDSFWAAQ